jgi:hypothetical protein
MIPANPPIILYLGFTWIYKVFSGSRGPLPGFYMARGGPICLPDTAGGVQAAATPKNLRCYARWSPWAVSYNGRFFSGDAQSGSKLQRRHWGLRATQT